MEKQPRSYIKITDELAQEVRNQAAQKVPTVEIKKYIEAQLKCKHTKAHDCYVEIMEGIKQYPKASKTPVFVTATVLTNEQYNNDAVILKTQVVEQQGQDKVIEVGPRHLYNEATKQHVFKLKNGDGFVIPSLHWKRINSQYTNGISFSHIATEHKVPEDVLKEILSIADVTRSSSGIVHEDRTTKTPEQIVKERIAVEFDQNIQTSRYKIIQGNSDSWEAFQKGVIEPLREMLAEWTPPTYQYVPSPTGAVNDNDVFVIGLSDIHYGSYTPASELFTGKSYSTEQAIKGMTRYLDSITETIKSRTKAPKKAIILGLGDLLHTLNGFTVKGTPLKFDILGIEQWKYAYDSIFNFIKSVLGIFQEVEVFSVKGNHADFCDWVLFEALSKYFHAEPRIKFVNFQSDHGTVHLGKDTVAIITHGASAHYKSIIPSGDAARAAWFSTLLLHCPDRSILDKKHKLLISADQHHLEIKEYAAFTHYMFPTAVAGDAYAEAKNLHNRASQMCLIVGDNGVKETLYYWLD